MQTLFPQIKPYARHELAVDGPHVLYVDESGSPDGLPVVFVHGGPGSGCDANSRSACRTSFSVSPNATCDLAEETMARAIHLR